MTLVLVATGLQHYREYLLRSISQRCDVHLFHTAEPTWEKAYITGWTVVSSTTDVPALVAAAADLADTTEVTGVLCWDEGRILPASFVAKVLGVRNGDPSVIWRLRDKAQTRQALAGTGVRQPRSELVGGLDDALAAAGRIGYPVVLKPRGLGGSIGVVRVDDDDQLRDRFEFASDAKAPDPVVYGSDERVLVEECVTGEEISVDSVVRDGVVTPLFVARKIVGYPPYAEEVGHTVDAADPLLTDPAFAATVQETHAALGFLDGWTHTEYMLTADGPTLIEVNGRLGGDTIPYLGMLATGIDPGAVATAAACGQDVDVTPTRRRCAAVRFFYPAEPDTTIGAIAFDDAVPLPPAVDQTITVARPGATVSPPPHGGVFDRIAYATAVGDTVAECVRALDAAEAALRVTVAEPAVTG